MSIRDPRTSDQRPARLDPRHEAGAPRPTTLLRPEGVLLLPWLLALAWGRPVVGQTGRPDTRASCYRALADWTREARSDPAPFGLHPTLASLVGNRARSTPRSELGIGFHSSEGILRASETIPSDDGYRYPGAAEEGPRSDPTTSLILRERAGPFALTADVAADPEEIVVSEAVAAAYPAGFVVSIGRTSPWSGYECWSGLTLSGRGETDALGLDTPWLRLPLVGRIALSTSFGTLSEGSSDNERPFFVVLRGVLGVGEDLWIGVTRSLLFGGRATSVPVTFRTVGLMLLGVTDVEGKDSDFENQVASVDVSYRTRVAGSPARLHAEYAVDDYGLAFLRVPALTVGGEVIGGTGDDVRSVGADVVWIAPSSRDYPPWYRHGALAWGWTDRGVPMGHELAGEGWGLRLDGFRGSERGNVAGRLLVSRRGDENLLAPAGAGWGVEGVLEGRRCLSPGVGGRVFLGIEAEAGRVGRHGYFALRTSALYRF